MIFNASIVQHTYKCDVDIDNYLELQTNNTLTRTFALDQNNSANSIVN